jgi:ribokinase
MFWIAGQRGAWAVAKIVVVGSINMDIVTRTQRFPEPGETLQAKDTSFHSGGKGANQAVAAAKLGAAVAMVGAVGDDPFGHVLRTELTSAGIDTSAVRMVPGASTGIASITVDDKGRNAILVTAGANARFHLEDVVGGGVWDGCEMVLLQNEILPETTIATMRHFDARGIRVVYNPAPVTPLPKDVLPHVDTLVVNEIEASRLTGFEVTNLASAVTAAETLMHFGARNVVLTMGGNGSVFAGKEAEGVLYVPSVKVDVVDTTAAGDTFIGAFAAALCAQAASGEGNIAEVLRFATAAAALSVTKPGAQPSIPSLADVQLFLASHDIPVRRI